MSSHRHTRVLNSIGWLFLYLSITGFIQAATITSTATGGTWSTATTWVGGVAPASGDAVVIATTGTGVVTMRASTTCASLTVNAGSKLVIGRRTLTVAGFVNNAGTITLTNGRITQNATGDFTNTGTITYTAAGRLYLTGSLTNSGTLTLGSATVFYTGKNTAASTSSGLTTTGLITYQRTAGSVTMTGNIKGAGLTVNATGGTFNLGVSLTHTFSGVVTLSAGTLNAGSSTLNANLLGTAWNYNGGTFTAGTGTVVFGGAGAQSIAGNLTSTFNNLTLSGTGLKTFTRIPVVNAVLSMEGTATVSAAPTYGAASTIRYKGAASVSTGVEFPATFAGSGGVIIDQGSANTVTLNQTKTAMAGNLNIKSGTFDLTTFTINRVSAGGTLTIAAGASLKIGGTNTLPSNYSTHSVNCTGTVDYSGTNQTVANLNSSQTYGNLTLSGSGIKTLQAGTTSICNNFTVSGTASVTGVVGLTIGGSIDIQAGSTFVSGAFTHYVGANWSMNGTFVANGSTINFNGVNNGNIGTSNFNNVIFSGTGLKIATGDLSIAGNLSITNNFSAGSFTHSVTGNWTNNGSFNSDSSTFLFNGSSSQSLTSSSTTTFFGLTMNGAGGVVLGVNTLVLGTLTLTSGKITLGTYNLTAETVSGGGSTSYVVTNNIGTLIRTVTAETATDFSVGNSAYNPITITNTTTGNIDNYYVRVIDGALTNANDNTKIVNRKWQIVEENAGGSALTLVASYNTAETGSGFNAADGPVFGYFNGISWSAPLTATAGGSGPYAFSSAAGAFTSDDLTNTNGFISLGSNNAFNASKLVISSINPTTPFVNQNNVTVTVQSQNSNNVLTNVTQNTGFSLSATNTGLSGTPTGTISANTFTTSITGVMFTTTSTTATVTATQTPASVLSAGTSAVFSVVIGNIYKPSATGNWSSVQWQISTDGGFVYTNTSVLPVNNNFGSSDAILVPTGVELTADVTASFYNMRVDGSLILTTGSLTLNHSGTGSDFGFQVFGIFQNSGGTFTNSNTTYPVLMQGGTYIHAMDGGSIPVATWTTYNSKISACQVTGVKNTAIASGLNQTFQHFTWNNAEQAVVQNLSANLTASGSLTLTNGVITTGAFRVIVTTTGSASSTNNARINGNFRKYVPNTLAPTVLFPIGDASNYTPISVTFTGTTIGSGYMDASTAVAQPPKASALSQTKYINRKWTLINTGVGGFTAYSPTFTFVDGDKVGSPNTSALAIRKLSGTIWSNTTTGTQGINSTQCTDLLTFGTFAIGEDNCSSLSATWFGGTSSDWNTGNNWCNGVVPTSGVDVYIPTGPVRQPVISAAASCKNLMIESGASLTMSGSNTLSIYGNWTLNGSFTQGTGTVMFTGSTAQSITGATAFNNLTINNATGVTAANNFTVNGILNLQSNNASTTKGTLDMGAYTLNMGVNATTTGIGDVTGIITRTHAFALNTFYSYGSINSGLIFEDVSGQTLPTSLSVKVSIGTTPNWSGSLGSIIQNPIKRLYSAIQTGGTGTSAIFRVHYRDDEFSGLNESKFSLWGRINNGANYYVQEIGKSNQDISNNFIAIQDVDLIDIPSVWDNYQMTIAPTQAVILTWVGGTTNAENNWNTAENWEPVAIPSSDYALLIPDASTTDFDPVLPAGDNSCMSVLIEGGGILNSADGAYLALTGSDAIWTKEAGGVFNAGNSTIVVAGTAGHGSFVGSTDFYNVTINDGGNLRPASGSYTGITGTLSLSTTGVLDAVANINTFEFKGSSTQNIPNPNGSPAGYYNLVISGSGTKILPVELDIAGNFTNNGAVDALTNSSTVIMNGSTSQTIGGSSLTTFNNLTINNPAGVIAGNSFTVNGILNLVSANPSETIATLNMVTDWKDYPGTTNLNPGFNNMVSYYLNMGATATTAGMGDVTGIVKRTTITANTAYSFGNPYTTVSLTEATGVNGLTVTIRIGQLPGHIHTTDAVKRHFEIVPLVTDPETFTSTARVSVNFHYLDTELNGNSEVKLTTGGYDIDGGATEPDEHGRSAYDFTNNYIGLSNVPISYFIQKTNHIWRTIFFLRDYKELQKTWNGSVSSDWSIKENWTPSGTPSVGSMVVIPNALTTNNDPILPSVTATINTMTIENGGILTMGSNKLVIFNTMSAGWEDQNAIGNDPGTSTVVFARPGATVSGIGRFYNVEIADTSTVTLSPNSKFSIGNTIIRTGAGTGKFYADVYDGTVEYTKTGDQTVIFPDGSPQFHSLILSGSGTKTLPSSALILHGDLSLMGTATAVATNTLTIGGNFTLGSGTSFTAGSLIHTVAGNLLNNGGIFTSTGSTIVLNGTAAQTIGGTVPLTLTNLTISNTSATITASSALSCAGDLINPGMLDMATNVLAVIGTTTNTGTIITAVPTLKSASPIPEGKTWGGTIEYNSNAGSQTAVGGTYTNLAITGNSGAVAAADITVNGTVHLHSNPNPTTGGLEMGSYTLQMDLNGTYTGEGDVTGVVKRTGAFAVNMPYTFGSQFTSITFTGASSSRPTWITCKTVIGSAPSWRTSAVKRYYTFAVDKGDDRTIVNLRFLDAELDVSETDKNMLVFWDAYTGPTFSNFYPRGKSNVNAIDNWVSLTGMTINFFVPSSSLDYKQWGLSYNNISPITWTGNGSPTYAGDWSLPGNWNGGIPTATDAVLIPKLADLPADNNGLPTWNSATGVVQTLEIASGSAVSLGTADLTIHGDANAWVNNGTFTSTGTVFFSNKAKTATIGGTGVNNFNSIAVVENSFVQTATDCVLKIAGTLSAGDGSILDFTTNNNTVDFNGADQTILNPIGFGLNSGYHHLALSGTGTKTMPSTDLSISGNMTLSGTASIAPTNALTIAGALTIGSGAGFTAGNLTHNIGGDILNNGGTFDLAGSTIVLNGTSMQTIGGTVSTNFNNLTISNSSLARLLYDESFSNVLQIQDNASLTLETGPLLTFQPGATVTTATNSKIILKSDARYLNLSSSTPTLQMYRQLTGTQGWRMVASPVATYFSDMFKAPLVTQGFIGSTYPALQPNLMWWDETDGGTTLQGWRQPTNLTDALSAGRGYFHYVFNGAGITGGGNYTDNLPGNLSVTGVENFNGSGSYNFSLSYTAHDALTQTPSVYYDKTSLDQGWNLIANPTASTLDWDAGSGWTKTNVDNTIYVWDSSALSGNGDYLFWNGSTGTLLNGMIPPFQALWVHANTIAPALSFSNTAKTGTSATFFRSPDLNVNEALSIPVTLSGSKMETTSFITFTNKGVKGPDELDAYRLQSMSDTWIELYTLSSPDYVSPLVINNLALQDTGMVNIPLFVGGQIMGAGISDSYTLKWKLPVNWPSDWNISLQDHQASKAISMTDNTYYTFNYTSNTVTSTANSSMYSPKQLVKHFSKASQTTSNTPPFSIIVTRGGKEIKYMEPKPSILPNYPNPFSNSTLLRFSLPESAQVRMNVYDLNGICTETLTNAVYPAGLNEIKWQPRNNISGMYFIRFISGDTVETQKVIYKN